METPIKPEENQENGPKARTMKSEFIRLARKGFYLYHPPLQALIIYLGAAIIIGAGWGATITDVFMVGFYALTGFTLLSPVVNIFVPKWWRNTGLYILSLLLFWLLFELLLDLGGSRPGYIGEGGMIL